MSGNALLRSLLDIGRHSLDRDGRNATTLNDYHRESSGYAGEYAGGSEGEVDSSNIGLFGWLSSAMSRTTVLECTKCKVLQTQKTKADDTYSQGRLHMDNDGQ